MPMTDRERAQRYYDALKRITLYDSLDRLRLKGAWLREFIREWWRPMESTNARMRRVFPELGKK